MFEFSFRPVPDNVLLQVFIMNENNKQLFSLSSLTYELLLFSIYMYTITITTPVVTEKSRIHSSFTIIIIISKPILHSCSSPVALSNPRNISNFSTHPVPLIAHNFSAPTRSHPSHISRRDAANLAAVGCGIKAAGSE